MNAPAQLTMSHWEESSGRRGRESDNDALRATEESFIPKKTKPLRRATTCSRSGSVKPQCCHECAKIAEPERMGGVFTDIGREPEKLPSHGEKTSNRDGKHHSMNCQQSWKRSDDTKIALCQQAFSGQHFRGTEAILPAVAAPPTHTSDATNGLDSSCSEGE